MSFKVTGFGPFENSYDFLLVIILLLLLLFLGPTSTEPQAEILKLNNVNGNDISFGDHSILERDRIPPLKSHGQALEDELCFPCVLSDNRDAPANLLRHFCGCLMPCTCCFDGKRTDVGACQTGVFVPLVPCCSVSCCTCFDHCAADIIIIIIIIIIISDY